MQIHLAKSAGFCFGVKRAVKIATEITKEKHCVYMLGDIVHNEDVINRFSRRGVKRVNRLSQKKNGIFLVAAHGASVDLLNRARCYGYKIVDATCPMVKEIHKIVEKMDKLGYRIIIIGDRNHTEVIGIAGQIKKKSIIIETVQDLEKLGKLSKAAVVVQSTQDVKKVLQFKKILEKKIKDLKFFNTICASTRIRQEETRALPKENDLIIVIGSKKSANTKRLFQIAKTINKNSHWINTKHEIKKRWVKGVKSVGITAGASTPLENIKAVVGYIREIGEASK